MKARIACLILLLSALGAYAQSEAWRVKFVAGPYAMGGTDLQMTVAPERLTFTSSSKRFVALKPLVVPMAAVTKIVYSDVEFNRGKAMAGSPSIFPLQGAQPGVAGANLGYLMVLGIASGMHGQKHYISVQWEEEGVEQELRVEAPKDTAPAVIASLEKAAGPKWMDLERRCTKAMEEISKQRDKAFTIDLEQAVQAANFHLAAGKYEGVLLQDGRGGGDLYFFAQTIAPENLKAIVAVGVAQAVVGTNKTYVTVTGPARLSEIRTPDWTLRLR